MLYGRLVLVGETFNRVADLGLRIAQKWFDDPLGSYSAAASPLAVTRGGEREREEKGWE